MLHSLRNGKNMEQALTSVLRVHFDYWDLTKFEQMMRTTVMPFYTWRARNTAFQVQRVLENPRLARAQYRVYQEMENDDPGFTPVWFEPTRFQTGIPGLSVRLPDPTLDLYETNKTLQSISQARGLDKFGVTVNWFVRDTSPIIKLPARLYQGRNELGWNQKDDGTRLVPVPVVGKIPALRGLAELIGAERVEGDDTGTVYTSPAMAGLIRDMIPVLGRADRVRGHPGAGCAGVLHGHLHGHRGGHRGRRGHQHRHRFGHRARRRRDLRGGFGADPRRL